MLQQVHLKSRVLQPEMFRKMRHLKRVLNESELGSFMRINLRTSKSLRTGFCCSIDKISVRGQLPSWMSKDFATGTELRYATFKLKDFEPYTSLIAGECVV